MERSFSSNTSKIRKVILRDVGIDIREIRKNLRKFNHSIIANKVNAFDNIVLLIRARNYLNNSISMSKTFFMPEVNKYVFDVQESSKSYKGFATNLGIANARLDLMQDELIKVDRSADFMSNPIAPARIENFKQGQKEVMETMILNSFKHAWSKFIYLELVPDEKGNVIKKDRQLFEYFLFLEFLHASEVIGALDRQLVLSNKSPSIKMGQLDYGSPPDMPLNPDLEPYNKNKLDISEYTSDPFGDMEE